MGGSVRDLLLNRPVTDVDLAVEGDPGSLARALARDLNGSPFPLSERHGAWRVVADGFWVDIAATRGGIEDDLALRDFTINAIALALDSGDVLDPHGGRADLTAGVVRAVGDAVFSDDPLRLLRLARIAHQLGFSIDQPTERLARSQVARAAEPSGERIYMEMRRLLEPDDPAAGVRLLDRLGVLEVVLPELAPTRGVEQSPFHHLDVFEHTLHVLDTAADLADHPAHYLPQHADLVTAVLDRLVGDGMTARQALRLAALFHDISKPQTRAVDERGRISFMGHDSQGAETAEAVLGRWKASAAVVRFCRVLVAEHLRLGFMVHDRPLGRRDAYRYARATEPHVVESVVLSLADRLATRGERARQRHLRAHAETAAELLGLWRELDGERREPLLRGDEVAREAGVTGREIGRLVEALAEEQAAGTVTTREEALRFVRQ